MNFIVDADTRLAKAEKMLSRSYVANPEFLPGLIVVIDLLLIALAAVMATIVTDVRPYAIDTHQVFATIFVAMIYLALGRHVGLFNVSALTRHLKRSDDVIVAIATGVLLLLSTMHALDLFELLGGAWTLVFALGAIVFVLSGRFIAARLLRAAWRRALIGRNIAVLGAGPQSEQFLRLFDRTKPYFMSIAGIFRGQGDTVGEQLCGYPVLGDASDMLLLARAGHIDDVVIAMPWQNDARVVDALEQLRELPVSVHLSMDLVGYSLSFRPASGPMRELPMFELVQRPISGWSAVLKRIEDYVLASMLVVLLSPVMLAIAIAIKLDSRGPVFFLQQRLGFNNSVFYIYKFRSMRHEKAPEVQVRQATRGDSRITRVGRFIRSTSLDELPQLFNVLDGTMSLVGPRPHAVSHNLEYGQQIRGYFARHKVKPGITGWAQVRGLRGETASLDLMEQRVQHDVYYAENWSLLFDLRILITTACVALWQRNAY